MDNASLTIPTHVGIIMDGNGRWAQKQGKSRSYGHKVGADAIERVATFLFESGVDYLSLYAFSTENFARPKEEVDYLMNLLNTGIEKYGKACLKNKIRLTVSGDLSVLSEHLQKTIALHTDRTKVFDKPVMNICLNYGARQELCHAFNHIIESGLKKVHFDINDLLEECRTNGYFDLNEIEYAVMECNGQLSIMPKSGYKPVTIKDLNLKESIQGLCANVVIDGNIMKENFANAYFCLPQIVKNYCTDGQKICAESE